MNDRTAFGAQSSTYGRFRNFVVNPLPEIYRFAVRAGYTLSAPLCVSIQYDQLQVVIRLNKYRSYTPVQVFTVFSYNNDRQERFFRVISFDYSPATEMNSEFVFEYT